MFKKLEEMTEWVLFMGEENENLMESAHGVKQIVKDIKEEYASLKKWDDDVFFFRAD